MDRDCTLSPQRPGSRLPGAYAGNPYRHYIGRSEAFLNVLSQKHEEGEWGKHLSETPVENPASGRQFDPAA